MSTNLKSSKLGLFTPPAPAYISPDKGYDSDKYSISSTDSTASTQDAGDAAAMEKGTENTAQLEQGAGGAAADPDAEVEDDEVTTYPEGGLRARLVVLGSFSAMFASFGMMNTIGAFNAYVSENQLKGYPASTIGWIWSIYVFLSFFCGLFIGPVFDARGPRALIFAGSICLVASMMLLGLCTEYYQFILVFSILGGVGTSLIFTPAVSAIAHWFNRKRATQTGLAAAGGSMGGIVFPLLLQALFPRVGFAWATRILGLIMAVLVAVGNLLIRSRLPRKANAPRSSVLPDFTIFRDGTGAFALTTAGVFFLEWGLFIPVTYLTADALAAGLQARLAYQLVAIFNAGSCLGRALPGYAADRCGRFNAQLATVALCTVSVFALWIPAAATAGAVHREPSSTAPLLIVFAAVFGFASGANISLTPICVGQLCDTAHYGRYYATCYTVVSFGTLTGIPIGGELIRMCGGAFWGVIVFTGLSYLASLGCFLGARGIKAGWGWRTVY